MEFLILKRMDQFWGVWSDNFPRKWLGEGEDNGRDALGCAAFNTNAMHVLSMRIPW